MPSEIKRIVCVSCCLPSASHLLLLVFCFSSFASHLLFLIFCFTDCFFFCIRFFVLILHDKLYSVLTLLYYFSIILFTLQSQALRELTEWVIRKETELSSLPTVAGDVTVIQRQREELQRIRQEVEAKRSLIESNISNGKQHILLREQSSLSDSSDASSDGTFNPFSLFLSLSLSLSLCSSHSLSLSLFLTSAILF